MILHKYDNLIELIIVEGKAHLKELETTTNSGSNPKIKRAFLETQKNMKISNNNWFGKYYQLANRLALINYLQNENEVKKINASLLYIYFLNGYEKRQLRNDKLIIVENKSVKKQADWEKVIKEQYNDLGISTIENQYISKIFIDCK